MTDSNSCVQADKHLPATRHTRAECPVGAPTFDDVAEAQGWNADSRETVLKSYIDSDQTLDLATFAQNVANEENEVTSPRVPDFSMDITGEYTGNAYPEQMEYRIRMTRGALDIVMSVEDTGGHLVGSPLDITEELADGITSMANTDHSLAPYEDDWEIPAGMGRSLSWTLQTNLDHFVRLDEAQIDEVAAWLRYATGEQEWDGGEDWEY